MARRGEREVDSWVNLGVGDGSERRGNEGRAWAWAWAWGWGWDRVHSEPARRFSAEENLCSRESKRKIQNSKFKIQNSKFKIQNSKFKIQNSKFKIQNSKFKIQNSKFKFKIQNQIEIEIAFIKANGVYVSPTPHSGHFPLNEISSFSYPCSTVDTYFWFLLNFSQRNCKGPRGVALTGALRLSKIC